MRWRAIEPSAGPSIRYNQGLPSMREPALASASETTRATTTLSSVRRPGAGVIATVPILVVVITFLFWYLTWFGRRLSDPEMDQYLADTSVPHKTQHALSQLAERIQRGDPRAGRWYPHLLR